MNDPASSNAQPHDPARNPLIERGDLELKRELELRRELALKLAALERPEQLPTALLELAQATLGVRGAALYARVDERLLRWITLGPLAGETEVPVTAAPWTALRLGRALEEPLPDGAHRLMAPLPTPHGEAVAVLTLEQLFPFEAEDRAWVKLLLELAGETWSRLWRTQRDRTLAEATTLSLMDRNVNKLCVSFGQLMQDALGETMLEVWGDLEGRSIYSRLFSQGLPRPAFSRRQRVGQAELRRSWGAESHRRGLPLAIEDTERPPVPPNALEQVQTQQNGIRSMLVVPIRGFATLYLGSLEPRLWLPPSVALCQSLAELLQTLLERNLNQHLLERREKALHALLIGSQSGLSTDMQGGQGHRLEGPVLPLERMLGLLTSTLRLEYATVLRPRGRGFELTAVHGPGLSLGSEWPREGSLAERTLREGYLHLSHPRALRTGLLPPDPLLERGVVHYSAVALPAGDGRMLGLLAVGGLEPFAALERDFFRTVLEVFAVRMAAELREQENRARLTATATVQGVLRQCRTSREVYQTTVQAAQRRSGDTNVLLLLFEPESDTLELVAATGPDTQNGARDESGELVVRIHLERGRGLAWRVLESGQPFYTPNASICAETVYLTHTRERVTYLGVPLTDGEGEVLGVLSIDADSPASSLALADQHSLEALAEAAGSAIARLQALEAAQDEAQRFERLAELSIQLELMENPLQMARAALETLIALTSFEAGALFLRQEDTLTQHLTVGKHSAQYLEQFGQHHFDLLLPRLIEMQFGERVMYRGEPEQGPTLQQMSIRSSVLMPLYSHGELYGALGLSSFKAFVPSSGRLFTLCEAISYRVERSLERSQNLIELRRTREQALSALGLMLEGRDLESGGHTERVTDLVSQVGLKLGLDLEALEHLRWGALLHDVGKVAIPDRVLLKPSALTVEEWTIMQAHTTLGEKLLEHLSFIPRAVLEVVRHHHEKWDGSGYPDRLSGPDIPLLARIFTLADVFDALRSERPYKSAWSVPEALGEIKRETGSQFDPALVEVFMEVVRETHALDVLEA